jgi:hypothetical protein
MIEPVFVNAPPPRLRRELREAIERAVGHRIRAAEWLTIERAIHTFRTIRRIARDAPTPVSVRHSLAALVCLEDWRIADAFARLDESTAALIDEVLYAVAGPGAASSPTPEQIRDAAATALRSLTSRRPTTARRRPAMGRPPAGYRRLLAEHARHLWTTLNGTEHGGTRWWGDAGRPAFRFVAALFLAVEGVSVRPDSLQRQMVAWSAPKKGARATP